MTFKYDEVKCPDCGGEMVSRSGKFGVFWGCKKFPECKGTRNSEGQSKAEYKAERDKRSFNKDKKDRAVLDDIMKEVDEHDLAEGQKVSFNKK